MSDPAAFADLASHLRPPTDNNRTSWGERQYDKKLEATAKTIKSWAEGIESGAVLDVTDEATDAAEWIRQV